MKALETYDEMYDFFLSRLRESIKEVGNDAEAVKNCYGNPSECRFSAYFAAGREPDGIYEGEVIPENRIIRKDQFEEAAQAFEAARETAFDEWVFDFKPTSYRIVAQTDGRMQKDIYYKGLSLKDAQKLMLDLYNQKYANERPLAKNWGLAVIQSKPFPDGAVPTFPDGTRAFDQDIWHYWMELEELEE